MHYGLGIMDYALWIMHYGLGIMDYALWIMHYGLCISKGKSLENYLING